MYTTNQNEHIFGSRLYSISQDPCFILSGATGVQAYYMKTHRFLLESTPLVRSGVKFNFNFILHIIKWALSRRFCRIEVNSMPKSKYSHRVACKQALSGGGGVLPHPPREPARRLLATDVRSDQMKFSRERKL